MSELLVAGVVNYVYRDVMHRNLHGEDLDSMTCKCPFKSFEEATEAYLLHKKRLESRYYFTDVELWSMKYRELLHARGYKKLRSRKRVIA